MQSRNVRFVADLVRSSGVMSDAAVLLVGEREADLEAWFAERGLEVTSIDDVERLSDALPEVERFLEGGGDRVLVVDDMVLALRIDRDDGAGPIPAGGDERLALLSICLAQASVAAAAGRRLDASLSGTQELRDRLERAEGDADQLSSDLARALNALAAERLEHDELRARFQGLKSSRAWPALVAGYSLMHRLRRLRARWARRGSGTDV